MSRLTRRDFLKLGALLPGTAAASRLAPQVYSAPSASGAAPNILIFVFDAMTARNLSVYGYRRKTTPNLERFAQRATVFNQHYSAANFTTPGVASLLTGLYPWTHRAFNQSGLVARPLAGDNIFRAMGERYFRLGYSQSMWASYFLEQFGRYIEERLPPSTFSLVEFIVGNRMPGDVNLAHRVLDEFLLQAGQAPPSLVFGVAERMMLRRAYARTPSPDYPRGLPRTGYYPIFFRMSEVFDGVMKTLGGLPAPHFSYIHFFSPHAPYRPTNKFEKYFNDGWRPKAKPDHILSDHSTPQHMAVRRQNYDEYVANVDSEFGRLLDFMSAKGILDNSYVLVTADHGEMFERGEEGHSTPLLYEPVVRVPLILSSPGQQSRQDVNVPTSSVDVLPTLVHLSGAPIPDWCEGQLLPGFGAAEDPQRSVYVMDAQTNPAYRPIEHGTFALRKGDHKLIYYRGFAQYGNEDRFELYDIRNDPEELDDLYAASLPLAQDLRRELLERVQAENAKFE
jgi:arylsulfatase A-like enzyme